MLSISKEGVLLEYWEETEEIILYRVEGRKRDEIYKKSVRWKGKPPYLSELFKMFRGSLEEIRDGLERLAS